MKTAIRYFNKCNLSNLDEVIINYTKEQSGDSLIDFTNRLSEKTRLVIVPEELNKNIKLFEEIKRIHPDISIMVDPDQDFFLLMENKIPFFFDNGVSSIDKLNYYVDMGVSDVYIVNELGFLLPKVSKYCHEHNVKVRVYPNVAQSSCPQKRDITTFFIRPEDIGKYEKYIDVIEFYGDIKNQMVYKEVYENKSWDSNLKHLIQDLDVNIDNNKIVPLFGDTRLACKKRCTFGDCSVCTEILSLAKTLKKKDYKFDI